MYGKTEQYFKGGNGMTAKEWLEKHHPLKPGEYYLSWTKLMEKYGKYRIGDSQ